MMPMHHFPVARQHGAFECVLELAHVTRPVITGQHIDRRRRDALDVALVLARELLEEVIDEQQHIRLALAQRRNEQGEDVQAVVEILAERAGRDRLLEILVGRRNQAHVGLDRLGAADALELALLQHAQQLDLRREVDVADLIEKQRAALREFEAPFLARLGAGERPLLVAEEFRLDQAVGQRRAADLDERLLGAQRAVVDRVGDQFLARARFAADQRGGVGAGHLRDLLEDLPHRTAAADQVREVVAFTQFLPQVRVLVDQVALVFLDQTMDLHRLRDHRRDNAEKLGAAVEVALGLVLQVDGQRANGAPVEADRHAYEAQLLVRQLGTPRGAMQERRFAADVRHHNRLPALHHLAGDPFAHAVADEARSVADAVGGLHAQVPVLVHHRHDAADGAVVAGENLEDAMERCLQVQRA